MSYGKHNDEYSYLLKFKLLGDSGVSKTPLLLALLMTNLQKALFHILVSIIN